MDCLGGLDGKERAKWNTLERREVQNWVPVDRLEPGIKRWTWKLTVVFCVGAGAVLRGLGWYSREGDCFRRGLAR